MASADIVVVGGGFAGLVAAAALAGIGDEITVLEALDAPISTFRGELIHPRGARMLSPLGLTAVFKHAGRVDVAGFAAFAPHDAVPVVLPYGCAAGLGLGIDHRAMIESLRRELAARANIRILRRKRVERLILGQRRV